MKSLNLLRRCIIAAALIAVIVWVAPARGQTIVVDSSPAAKPAFSRR